jgi:hypothetical protein
MTKRVLLTFVTLALAIASAKSYRVTLFQPSVLAGTELKAGEYKMDVTGDKVTLTNGRGSAQASVKVEKANEKFSSTTVRYSNGDGKLKIQEIRIGGTNMRLVVN